MPREVLIELLIPAMTLGILTTAAIAFTYLGFRMKHRLFRSTAGVVVVTLVYAVLDLVRMDVGVVAMNPGRAIQLHRLLELSVLALAFVAPPFFGALVGLKRKARWAANAVAVASGLFFLVTVVAAYVYPSSFIDVRITESSYTELKGAAGPLFYAGQALLASEFLAIFVLLLVRLARNQDRRNLLGMTIGLGVSIYLALSSVAKDVLGFYIDPLPTVVVSRAGVAAVVFAITSITNYVGRFIRQARELTRANAELLQSRAELERTRLRDELTQLPNRTALQETLAAALRRLDQAGSLETLAVVNVDEFHTVVDSYGYEAADDVLVQLSERLSAVSPGSATTYRTGSDEFVICPLRYADEKARRSSLERTLEFVSQPFLVGEATIYLTVSIGVAEFPRRDDSVERVMRRAYRALSDAKADRNTFRAFTPRMEEDARRTVDLVQQLRAGIRTRNFRIDYQPVVDRSRYVVGAEALVRWSSSFDDEIGPDTFIPIAEASGLIIPMSNWIVDRVVADEQEARANGLFPEISINISPRQLRTTELCDELLARLSASDASPNHFSIELTENTLVQNLHEISGSLHRLRKLGFGVSVDDFGTGYSSLSYLKHLPINRIKIDREFVKGLPSDKADSELVRTITALGHSFGHSIVAEGVETEEQYRFLKETGVDCFQGFLFSPGLPLEEFIRLLHEQS